RYSASPLAGLGHFLPVIAIADFGNWVTDFSDWVYYCMISVVLGSAVLWLIWAVLWRTGGPVT
ncbi:hypothetical protein GIB67_029701, partial [Kingdonia uniflora]